MGDPIFFYVFATLVIAAATGVVFFSNPLSSAMSLVVSLAGLAGLFVLLEAHFLAAIQILVYAGAVMVLFIFVIMMFNLRHSYRHLKVSFASLLGLVVALNISILLVMRLIQPQVVGNAVGADFGTVNGVGKLLLTKYLVPFEIISVLLTVAAVGAIVLAQREKESS
jgi:NADH-quinone oxidoreductase subunit J